MDFSDLRVFNHLAQTLHFGRSARALGMSASSLSRRIQALEAELGQPLLWRDQRQVQLTSAGRRFREFARQMLQQWVEFQSHVQSAAQVPSGELYVACTVTACHSVLPQLLTQFRHLYPNVTLRLTTQDASRSREQLEAGEVDLAIIPTDADVGGQFGALRALPLASTPLVFIAPRNCPESERAWMHPQTPSALAAVPLVAPLAGLERQRLDQWFAEHHLVPSIVAEVAGNEAIISMVTLGCGVGLVPRIVLAASPLQDSVDVLEDLPAPPGYHVSLCARPKSLGRQLVALFLKLAEDNHAHESQINATR